MADNPITRKEKYLAKLTGSYTGNVPAPITRVEKYLYDLCQKGISGLTPEEIENAVNKYLEGKDYVTKADADKAYQPAGSYLSGTDEDLAVSGKAADAKAVGNAVAKIEGINYTDRGTLADTDAFLINDGTGMKKSVLSKLSDFVLGKIADKVFEKLQTNDKTILGAINELNSKIFPQNYITHGSDSIIPHENISIDKYSRIMAFGIITIVCIKFIANSPIEAWETIATLPVTNNKAESMGYITGNNMIYVSGKSNKIVSVNTLGAGEYAGLLVF